MSKVHVEKRLWLFPIEGRRDPIGNGLAGMLHGISLSGCLQMVDWSSRLIRPGKVSLSACVPDILARLQINAESWKATLEKLIGTTKFVGTCFGNTARLDEAAAYRGIKFLKNITGRETPLTSPHASEYGIGRAQSHQRRSERRLFSRRSQSSAHENLLRLFSRGKRPVATSTPHAIRQTHVSRPLFQ